MPKIPQQTRQVSPQMVEGVRVSPESMTQEARAIAGFGQGLTEVSRLGFAFATKLKEAKITTEYSNAETAAKKGWADFGLNLQNLHYTKYNEEAQKTKDTLYKNISETITEPLAKAQFNKFWNDYTIEQGKTIGKLAIQGEIDQGAADYYRNLKTLEDLGDIQGIKDLTVRAVGAKHLHADVAAKAEIASIGRAEATIKERIIGNAWSLMLKAPDRDTAISIIESVEGISATERNALINRYDKEQTLIKAQQTEALEKTREAWKTENLKKLRTGALTFSDIDSSPLEADKKEQWVGWLDQRNKAIADGKKDPLVETNNTVYGRVAERINLNPETISKEKDIWAFHGKGLSTDDCVKLEGQLKSNLADPLKADISKRYHSLLRIYLTEGLLSSNIKENADIYGQKANALDRFLKTDPTDQEVEVYFRSLVSGEKRDWLDRLWDNFFNPKLGSASMLPKRKEGESIREYQQRVDETQPTEKVGTTEDLKSKYGLE